MSPALLHALARPLSLSVRGLHRATQLALRHTTTTRRKCLHNRTALCEARAVRYCSGHTTHGPDSFITAPEEDEIEKHLMAPDSLSKAHQTDLSSLATSEEFLLPSQQRRKESNLLVVKIKECESVAAAFEVYERHNDVMETKHCLALLEKLGVLAKNSEDSSAQTQQSEGFSALCDQLYSQCRRMEVDDWLNLLKYLCLLRVPATSKLCQVALQMLKHQINDLTLKQLIFLDFLLKKMERTPLSEALLTATPILLSNILPSAFLNELSFSYLSLAFTICCQGKVKGLGILLQEMYKRGSVRDTILAMSLVWSLTRVSSPQLQRRLLTQEEQLTREVIMKECLETLARDTDSLSSHQMESTLTKLSMGHDFGDRSCYNERFLNAAASFVCRHSLPFEKTAHTITKMSKMNYISEELVQYAVKLMISQPEDISQAKVGMVSLLSAVTVTPLPPEELKAVLDVMMTHKSLQMNSEYYKKPLLQVAVELLSVEYYHPQLMQILTSPDTLSLFMSKYHKENINHSRLVDVDQALGRLVSSPHRVPETFLEPGRRLRASQQPTRSFLKAMLHQILPDPSYLMSGLLSGGGIFIDHLLVLDPEGEPIKLTSAKDPINKNQFISSLDLPVSATKIAIMDIGSRGAYRPAGVLKAPQRLRQRLLEAEGFRVLPLLQLVIFHHHEEEKILYVKRELMDAGLSLSYEVEER
ncbi:uncharacterized protein LOC123512184 [Portunus trituberculatus]|uniref:uncharacterized protein LOC123512184 n=1 Tax=Portunus trituberculatus TaxID=210409 RepID=UPI001E1D12EC|nr:uncharacterized protein LOC123512184 [Portunus trituberculatus]